MREIVARRAKQIADEALMRSVHGGGGGGGLNQLTGGVIAGPGTGAQDAQVVWQRVPVAAGTTTATPWRRHVINESGGAVILNMPDLSGMSTPPGGAGVQIAIKILVGPSTNGLTVNAFGSGTIEQSLEEAGFGRRLCGVGHIQFLG